MGRKTVEIILKVDLGMEILEADDYPRKVERAINLLRSILHMPRWYEEYMNFLIREEKKSWKRYVLRLWK